jgi:LuxR family maltose regulon positive regulatory protein
MDESAALEDQLLVTKFFPPSASHALILRPRLLTVLTRRFEYPLTLISAPAGFGKTTLLSNWIHSLPPERARVAWLSLDEGDNEPVLFWRYVLTSLDHT